MLAPARVALTGLDLTIPVQPRVAHFSGLSTHPTSGGLAVTEKRHPSACLASLTLEGMSAPQLPDGYATLLGDLKQQIRSAQIRAALSVNRELLHLYWQIGRLLVERQKNARWGAKVLDQLSADLRREFPDIKGFSTTNLKYMRSFAAAYPTSRMVNRLLTNCPGGTW